MESVAGEILARTAGESGGKMKNRPLGVGVIPSEPLDQGRGLLLTFLD